jgi:hypothetical protein
MRVGVYHPHQQKPAHHELRWRQDESSAIVLSMRALTPIGDVVGADGVKFEHLAGGDVEVEPLGGTNVEEG